MPDGQEAAKERGQRAFLAWLRTSLSEEQVQKILSSGTLYNGYVQIFSDYVASGQIDPNVLLQTTGTEAETKAITEELTQSQAELSNWLLKQYKEKYLPWRITNEGLTEEEGDILYSELRDQLFPKVPQTQEEKAKWFREQYGQALPYNIDVSGATTIDWQAVDAALEAEGVKPKPVSQTQQYRDFVRFRESQLSGYEKNLLKRQESLAKQKLLDAAGVARDYGIPQSAIQSLAPEMADQWMQAQFQTHLARSEQWQEQEQKRQTDLTTTRMEAESRRIAAQQEAYRQQEAARIDQRTQERLLPMPDIEGQYEEVVEGFVSPAQKKFFSGKVGEFFRGNLEEATIQWWKMLNEPIIQEGEAMKAAIGRPDALGYVDTTGLQEQFGISKGEAYRAAERYAYNPTAFEFETLPTGGREALAGTLAEARTKAEGAGDEEDYTGALARLRRQPSPWEGYLSSKDWYREFITTPRAYRPGGYTQRSLAPSIRRRF